MAVKAEEVLAFKDYGTHVVVVTKDGQKLTSSGEEKARMNWARLIAALAACGGLRSGTAVDGALREAAATPEASTHPDCTPMQSPKRL